MVGIPGYDGDGGMVLEWHENDIDGLKISPGKNKALLIRKIYEIKNILTQTLCY